MSDDNAFLEHFTEKDEEALEHHGVKGMKWGIRKQRDKVGTSDSGKSGGSKTVAKKEKKPRKRLSADQKKLLNMISKIAVSYAIKRGISWARENPDKIANFFLRAQTTYARTQNFMNGTKALGPGYEVFKMTMSESGVYR